MRSSRPARGAGSRRLTARRASRIGTETARRASRIGTETARRASRIGTETARRASRIADLLIAAYPDARCMLDHRSPFELLVATILAAQCTDERVNSVTPQLFARLPGPAELASADRAVVEDLVRSTGFYRAKAKSIQAAAAALASRTSGAFPSTMEELVALPGVGRKTANVVLGTCFGEPAIIVDTHVRRVAGRLGLAASTDPDRIELELQGLLPPARWTMFSHALTFHGRRCCHARKPGCASCVLHALCPSAGS